MAEIAANVIAMRLGGYLAAKTDLEHYMSERKRELHEIRESPLEETKEIIEISHQYGLKKHFYDSFIS